MCGDAIALGRQGSQSHTIISYDAMVTLSRRPNSDISTLQSWGSVSGSEHDAANDDGKRGGCGHVESTQQHASCCASTPPENVNVSATQLPSAPEPVFGCGWVWPVCLPTGTAPLITIQLAGHPGWGSGSGQVIAGCVVRVVASQGQAVLLDAHVGVSNGGQLR